MVIYIADSYLQQLYIKSDRHKLSLCILHYMYLLRMWIGNDQIKKKTISYTTGREYRHELNRYLTS